MTSTQNFRSQTPRRKSNRGRRIQQILLNPPGDKARVPAEQEITIGDPENLLVVADAAAADVEAADVAETKAERAAETSHATVAARRAILSQTVLVGLEHGPTRVVAREFRR